MISLLSTNLASGVTSTAVISAMDEWIDPSIPIRVATPEERSKIEELVRRWDSLNEDEQRQQMRTEIRRETCTPYELMDKGTFIDLTTGTKVVLISTWAALVCTAGDLWDVILPF
jgi:hypothetical protein